LKLHLKDWPESFETWTHALASNERLQLDIPEFRRAAVLVGLTLEAAPRLLLTVRTHDLPTHKGQISFPGGRLETAETPTEGAIRETWEEVGLEPALIQPIGLLDDVWTPQGFLVTPLLAAIPAAPQLDLNPGEVSEVLFVPVADLFALETRLEIRQPAPGMRFPSTLESNVREVIHYDWNGYDIWGMTARVIQSVLTTIEVLPHQTPS
jgi:8-oxo-dGTP pyrophosphatase MutT (NUDIX family)